MQIKSLFWEFDRLQLKHWDKNLDAIYGWGEIINPKFFFVFMNPTWKNVASNKEWKWLKAQWIWTKNIWKMFYQLWFLDKNIFEKSQSKKSTERDYNFAETLYQEIKKNWIYITNLSKATQVDARPLNNNVFKDYLELLKQEIDEIKPKTIITFWNQVSSIFLNKNIQVWLYRKKFEITEINKIFYKTFPVYYPVWQGMRNMKIAQEDINWIKDNLD